MKLAKQLRKPLDSDGVRVANGMNKTNKSANRKVIQLMSFIDNDHVLEIGHGNGVFAEEICKQAKNISYTGIDWSQTMIEEAKSVNSKSMKSHSIRFQHGNSSKLKFANESFNYVLTVHTIYFWKHPAQHFSEIHRVLKSQGHFYLAFGDCHFMEKLPFTQYGFKLYRRSEIFNLLQQAGFRVVKSQQFKETGTSNSGQFQNKIINIIECVPISSQSN